MSIVIDDYKKQLSLLAELGYDVQKEFRCPFCLQYIHDPVKISREDAPQEALGGCKIALTCKDCNNRYGWLIDCHLINATIVDEESVLPENLESKIELLSGSYKGKTIRALLKDKGDGLEIIYLPDRNDPKVLDAEWEALESGKMDEVQFCFQRITPKIYKGKREAALLKNAYVILLSYFGYAFLLDPFYDRLRVQMEKPLDEIIPGGLVSTEGVLGEIPDGVYVSENYPLRGFLVAFTLKRRWEHHYSVFIPAISNGYEAAIEKLRTLDAKDVLKVGMVEQTAAFWDNKDTIKAVIDWSHSKNKSWVEVEAISELSKVNYASIR